MRFSLLLFLLAVCGCRAHKKAEVASGPEAWAGEWGAFSGPAYDYTGKALRVGDCAAAGCRVSMVAQKEYKYCQADGMLVPGVPGVPGVADVRVARGGESCVLHARMQGGAVRLTTVAPGCAQVCQGDELTFADGDYGLRSRAPFFAVDTRELSDPMPHGDGLEDCYMAAGAGLKAVCGDRSLLALVQEWDGAASTVAGLQGQNKLPELSQVTSACDANAKPADCVRTRLTSDVGRMRAVMTQWNARGDRGTGDVAADKIMGHYTNSFEDGDVSGASYKATDVLDIGRAPDAPGSIRFSVNLNFYNGDTCSADGVAEWKENGSFVYADTTDTESPGEACLLQITPTAKGVSFADPTGNCKALCGIRGGWKDAGFTFAQRTAKQARFSGR